MTANDTQTQNFSNDATPTILGFEYQKLFALECCLNAQPGDIVYIECFGDIAINDTSYETKHHDPTKSMSDQSPDFWKTLRNHVKNKGKISQFTKLILHTTATLPKDSVFSNWNDLSGEEKIKRLEPIRKNPNKGIEDFVKLIYTFNKSYSKKDLIEILDKFEIHPYQKTFEEKYHQIKNHPCLFVVDEKYRKNIIQSLHGLISLKAIENSYRWEIVISEFNKDLRNTIQQYCRNEIPFPELPPEVEYTGNEKFQFINELKSIELENEVQIAVIDFLRAEKSTFELLKWGAIKVQNSIDSFENELHDRMSNSKKKIALNISQPDLLTPQSIRKSKELYFTCRGMGKLRIRGVQEIQFYYQHGKMHKIVNDHKFVWRFLPEDLT